MGDLSPTVLGVVVIFTVLFHFIRVYYDLGMLVTWKNVQSG